MFGKFLKAAKSGLKYATATLISGVTAVVPAFAALSLPEDDLPFKFTPNILPEIHDGPLHEQCLVSAFELIGSTYTTEVQEPIVQDGELIQVELFKAQTTVNGYGLAGVSLINEEGNQQVYFATLISGAGMLKRDNDEHVHLDVQYDYANQQYVHYHLLSSPEEFTGKDGVSELIPSVQADEDGFSFEDHFAETKVFYSNDIMAQFKNAGAFQSDPVIQAAFTAYDHTVRCLQNPSAYLGN